MVCALIRCSFISSNTDMRSFVVIILLLKQTAAQPAVCWNVGGSQAYDGEIAVTQAGVTCQAWSAQTPHNHDRGDMEQFTYPDSSLADAQNHCRDPDLERAPWCYTMEPEPRWDFCDVPLCAEEPACTCSIKGDPHITMFDGQKINYQGVCLFLIAELGKAGCSVTVRAKTVRRNPNRWPAYVEKIYVNIGPEADEIEIGQDKETKVNSVPISPIYPAPGYVITQVGDFIVVTTECGLTAMYDGEKTAKVIINEEDGDIMTGMCGNCNGLQDDLKTEDGTDVSNDPDRFKKIGNSYAIAPLDDCILPAT